VDAERFARWIFRGAAIYGAIVLTPLLFQPTPAGARIEINLGFIGLALVFQGVFWIIGGDPRRYRAVMPMAVLEKLVFAIPALTLFALGRLGGMVAAFAGIDLLLAVLFAVVWWRVPVVSGVPR
jgi:hypothetical protein